METLDKIRQRIDTTEDLESVVRTMKALAAVNIRQYERAVESLNEYQKSIEAGFQIVLQESPGVLAYAKAAPRHRICAVVFGSDQGMCGPLNDRIVDYTLKATGPGSIEGSEFRFMAIGSRVASRLTDTGHPPASEFRLPASVPAISEQVQQLLFEIETWQSHGLVDQLVLFYCRHLSRASYEPTREDLLPLDERWLASLKEKEWQGRSLPLFTMEATSLFSALIQQHLFIGIYRAFAESLASENASRLASMRRAEQNIDDRLDELKRQYHQQRQLAVTSELLDIVSAFEALGQGDSY